MQENTGNIARFSLIYEKVNKIDSLQPDGCNRPLAIKIILKINSQSSPAVSHKVADKIQSWIYIATNNQVSPQYYLQSIKHHSFN